jgi:hypothetical protein
MGSKTDDVHHYVHSCKHEPSCSNSKHRSALAPSRASSIIQCSTPTHHEKSIFQSLPVCISFNAMSTSYNYASQFDSRRLAEI